MVHHDFCVATRFIGSRLKKSCRFTLAKSARLIGAELQESDANLAFAPATELLTLISNGGVSSTELTELYLARIEEIDPQLNAYVTVTPELALDQAAKADEATARGENLGPLHGLPISLKDLQMTKGVRTTGGSLAYKDRVPYRQRHERSARLGRRRRHARQDKLS